MNDKDVRLRIQQYIDRLSLEELEEKVAPLDCQKKPNHPDCAATTFYGGPAPEYGGPVGRYGGPM